MDPFRRAMFFGLGVISLKRKEAEEIIDDLVQRGEMSRDDRTPMVERLLKEAQMQKDELEEKVAVSVQKTMNDIGLPTQADFKKIENRLEGIEKAIAPHKREKRGIHA